MRSISLQPRFMALFGFWAMLSVPVGAQSIALVRGHVSACNSLACTLAAASGSGNLLVVGIDIINTGVTVASVTDNVGNVYTEASGSRATDTSSNWASDIWYAKNSVAGATTVTITTSGPVSGFATVIWEFSGADLNAPVDRTSALNNHASSSTALGASVTTTASNEAIVSLSAGAGAITGISAGNTFSNDSGLAARGWAHLITATAGTYAASWAANPAGTYASSTVSFQAAGSGSVGATGSCDLNSDGSVNVLDVQLITNMEIGASGFSCSANIGGVLGCSDIARQVVIKSALGQGCHFISLTWAPSSSTGVAGYNVYRGTASGGESSTPLNSGGLVTTTSFTDVSTLGGVTYFYTVKASNGSTESSPSPEASATAQ